MARRSLLLTALALVTAAALVGAGWLWYMARQQALQKASAMDLIEASRALRAFHTKNGAFPLAVDERPFEAIVADLPRRSGREISATDRWGHPLVYRSDGEHYLLWSPGRDGVVERYPGGGKQRGLDVDLIVYDGRFWQQAHGI